LERKLFNTRELTSRAIKEITMIDVTVHDVMLRAPKDDPEAEWLPGRGKKYKLGFTRVVLLKEMAGDRILPIWVGAVEGDAIAMLLVGVAAARPSTFELTTKLLDVAKTTMEKVAVTTLRDNTYYATMWVKLRGRLHEVDARPSDAITLALRTKAPIFVTPELMEQAGQLILTPNNIPEALEAIRLKYADKTQPQTEEMEREWRSFRSLPRGDMGGWLKPAEK
jgi:bifunctional DNase/RNase